MSNSTTILADLADRIADAARDVRGRFDGDDGAFVEAMIDKAGVPKDFAHKLPDLLSGEYAEDAWFDALFTDENIEWIARVEAAI